jgi:hypothetical protein
MTIKKYYSLILLLVVAGCLIQPLPNKSRFPEEMLTKLSLQYADRSLVLSLFGKPTAIKKNGEYWFYGDSRETVGILAGSGNGTIWDYEWLAVQFDQHDNVKFHEFNESVSGCLSNGICNIYGLGDVTVTGNSVLTSPSGEDLTAKNYRVKDDECAVYFYQEPVFLIRMANGPVDLMVNDVRIGVINYETYLFLTHTTGELSLKAYQFNIHTRCNAGEKLYLKAEEQGWSRKEGKDFAPVPSKLGEAEIQKRRLALPD